MGLKLAGRVMFKLALVHQNLIFETVTDDCSCGRAGHTAEVESQNQTGAPPPTPEGQRVDPLGQCSW